jgi:hypothetical protein
MTLSRNQFAGAAGVSRQAVVKALRRSWLTWQEWERARRREAAEPKSAAEVPPGGLFENWDGLTYDVAKAQQLVDTMFAPSNEPFALVVQLMEALRDELAELRALVEGGRENVCIEDDPVLRQPAQRRIKTLARGTRAHVL